jgi:hypothetical protein
MNKDAEILKSIVELLCEQTRFAIAYLRYHSERNRLETKITRLKRCEYSQS